MSGGWLPAPIPPMVPAPGWTDTEPVPLEPIVEVGWWAVLTLDLRTTAPATQAMAFQSIKGLALANLAAGSQSLALRKIAMMALADTAPATQALALQKVAMLALANTAPAIQALGLTKVMELALAASVAPASQALGLTRVGTLTLTNTAPATQTLGLRKIAPLAITDTAPATQTLTMQKIALMALSNTAPALSALSIGFPPNADAYTEFAVIGAYTYTVPRWADYIDVIVIGGGAAGTNGSFVGNGAGGQAGHFDGVRLVRGSVDLPWDALTITGIVGNGGGPSGGAGQDTTAIVGGITVVTGLRGSGNVGTTVTTGQGAGSFIFQGIEAVGGGPQANLNNNGNPPGGGGAGGGFLSNGGRGGIGRAWMRAGQF